MLRQPPRSTRPAPPFPYTTLFRSKGPRIDIALDPLEGTTITAKAGPNALAVLAIAEEGCVLNAPDVYMDKLAVGPGYSPGIIDLNKSVRENVEAVAREKGVDASEIIVDRKSKRLNSSH